MIRRLQTFAMLLFMFGTWLGCGRDDQPASSIAVSVKHDSLLALTHDESDTGDSLGERLFREAKAAARADHPAIITTYGYGTDAELAISYVVMECLSGETLAQRLERQRSCL